MQRVRVTRERREKEEGQTESSRRERKRAREEREGRLSFASRSIWPWNVGGLVTVLWKQPNSPHVDSTKAEGERERERRKTEKETGSKMKRQEGPTEYEPTRGPYQR